MSEWYKLLVVLAVSQPACRAEPPPTTPAAPAAAEVRPAASPRARVLELLQQIPRGEPVLGAVRPETRARFDALLEALSEQERALLRSDAGPIARERPLLHLMAGGRSRTALLALATSASAARELTEDAGGSANLARAMETTNQVIRRAALEWLRLARGSLERQEEVDVGFCDALDQVAGTLDQLELRRAARELWVELEDSPAARLNLARAALWTGDRQVAREQHARALGAHAGGRISLAEAGLTPKLKLFANQISELIDRAERTDIAPQSIDEAVEHARTHLALRDPRAARRVLEPHASAAGEHLGLATMLVISAHPELPCPGVTAGLGDARLCAFTLEHGVFQTQAYAKLEQAWQSGRGRSLGSVQDYLGLKVVLPWRSQGFAPNPARDVPERARELAELSAQATELSPEFSGLALFGRALATGAAAAEAATPGAAPTLPQAARLELVEAAQNLRLDGGLQAAALLSVVAVLVQHQDVRELYRRLGPQQDIELENSRLAIGAWLAAAWGDAELFEAVKAEAITLLTELDSRSLASSTLVLLLAEAANLIDPTPENQQALTQVTRQLSDPGIPVELRLRAALTKASLVERSEGASAAARSLEQLLAGSVPPSVHDPSSELHLVARARLLLVAESASAAERLAAFREIFGERTYPPSIEVWRRSWEIELEHRVREEACAKRAACVKRAQQERDKLMAAVRATAPAVAGRLHDKGALSLGSLQMNLDYQPGAGLLAIVRTQPMLVFLPFPMSTTQ